MECCLVRHFYLPNPRVNPPLFSASNRQKHGVLRATGLHLHREDDGSDPSFQAAIKRASIRFKESLRQEPLFVDPYAGCLATPDIESDVEMELELSSHPYIIGTKFIDDKLLSLTKNLDGPKQVVLFTDGMDTRAYRLNWPSSTVIFDVSPEGVFKTAAEKLQEVGAKIPRSCLLRHVSLESSNLHQLLIDKGFSGSRPSIWAFQGLPITNLASFKENLFMASSLVMKGCLFLGEFPTLVTETELGIKSSTERWMDELFMSYGFRVNVIGFDEVAKNLGKRSAMQENNDMLFVAEHLRFSDDQMDIWRREFQRLEEDGDEEGFEEL